MPPPVVKLSRHGGTGASDATGRNASHVRYVATHGAQTANAAHVVYQATHGALLDAEGARLIGNAAQAGEEVAILEAGQHEGHQWRLVVSLRGDDADRLGDRTAGDWHRLAHEVVPGLAAAVGVHPESLRWVAAHHDPTPAAGRERHPHLHIAVWSADPMSREHRLTRAELREARRAVTRAIYGPERARLGEQKTALREAIRRAGAQTLGEALVVLRAQRGRIALAPGPQAELCSRLSALAEMMPGRGRMALAYMPLEARQAARDLADFILTAEELVTHLEQYRATAREMAAMYTEDPARVARAELRAYADLRDRIAQAALRTAGELERSLRTASGGGPEAELRSSLVQRAARGLMRAVTEAVQQPPARRAPEKQRLRQPDGRGRDH